LITAEITTAKDGAKAALAKADPPGNDYEGAIKDFAAVDKGIATAELKILDELVKGKSRDEMEKELKDIFKKRFGVKIEMEASTDTQQQELDSMKRLYQLMAEVPESHATNNSSIKKIDRTGGDEGGSEYLSRTKKVVLKCERPGSGQTKPLQDGMTDPPIEEDAKLRPGVSPNQDYFDWTTLHELAHGIDDKKGFMKAKKGQGDYGGWAASRWGQDVIGKAAEAAAVKFNFNTKAAIKYIKALMRGAAASRPAEKHRPPAPKDHPDWDGARANVEAWVDSTRTDKSPWANPPADINGTIYHEAYSNDWVSYLKSARAQGIKHYQFRAPGEWFADIYAAYHSGVLKDSHPAIKRFLRDL
jgi:hypothetical protein